MPEPSHAVFLSYASEDAAAAERIATALRAVGIDVWLDTSELRGGDVWDRQIRKQIHDCALFVPVISAHSDARHEGYFRREWRLAVERAGDMAEDVTFLIPVVVDNTPDAIARVPDRFREVQWSRLPDGQPSPAFVERVQRLLSPAPTTTSSPTAGVASGVVGPARQPVQASWRSKPALLAIVVVIIGSLAYWSVDRIWISKHPASPTPAAAPTSAAPTAFSPPPHSIAVLPFVNMSRDKEQEYFSDGLTEELLNSLARINELQVAARTSAFSFKGKDTDIGTIARKLNVAAVLEGSVRRSGNTVRITAQLINAITGFHLWSETYDRDLGDVLKLQTEIATAVAGALKVTLLGDVATKIEVGGTRNPAAFDAYLRATKVYFDAQDAKGALAAIDAYTEVVRLDPGYGLAYADRSLARVRFVGNWAKGAAARDYLNKAETDARKAIALAPTLAEGHLALAQVLRGSLEFTAATQEFERAFGLEPGNARVLRAYSGFAVLMGKTEAGLAAAHRAVALDPLNFRNHLALGIDLVNARRHAEAISTLMQAKTLNPEDRSADYWLGLAYYFSGNFEAARAACERGEEADTSDCLAVVYHKLRRHTDAERALASAQASHGDAYAAFYAFIYGQWGDTARALDWLETALRNHNGALDYLKMEGFDPLRNEPRFQAVMRELKFPQ